MSVRREQRRHLVQQNLPVARLAAQYCSDSVTTTPESLATVIQQAIDDGLIVLRRKTRKHVKAQSDDPEYGSSHYLAVGSELEHESEPVRQAILYASGLYPLVYGKSITQEEIQISLGFLPEDNFESFVKLFKYKKWYQGQCEEGLPSAR